MSSLSGLTGIEIWALWALVAVGLLIFEILMIGGFFLSFSASGFGIAAWAYFNSSTASGSDLWQWVAFSFLGLVLYYPIRILMRKFSADREDINNY